MRLVELVIVSEISVLSTVLNTRTIRQQDEEALPGVGLGEGKEEEPVEPSHTVYGVKL